MNNNVDDNNIIYSNGEVNGDNKWGTWEELILTCAVKRHGLTDWDSVSKEVSSLTSLTTTASAVNCEIKYKDLKRRFNDDGDVITEKLRSIRIDELKRDVQRCDDSIESLQLKVKKLEEEKRMDSDLVRLNRSGSDPVKEMSNSGELGESGTYAGEESQPLINVIKRIRSHPCGSMFESRLSCQETKNYKSLIRQHLDIKTIEKKLEKGSYVSSSLLFYRDLKLLFTNAIVYFPMSSLEAMAAHELRTLVDNEMKKQTGRLGHIVVKAEAVQPLVACKKKTSVSKKPSPSSSFKQKDEKKSQEEEKTVTTTARTSRRASKGNDVVAKNTKRGRAKKQTDSKTVSSDDDDEVIKEEKPKLEKKIASEKKKSVADFLKRIKKNSPQKVKETTSKDPKKKKCDENVKKEAKPMELRSNTRGKKKVEVENTSKRKQPKKEAEEVATTTGKRGRESEKDNKQQPKKRGRRRNG